MKSDARHQVTIGLLSIGVMLLLVACDRAMPAQAPETGVPATNTPEPAATATRPPATATADLEVAAEPTGQLAGELAPTEEPTPEPLEAQVTMESSAETTLNTLLAAYPAPPEAQGEILLLSGRVLDVNGEALPGAAVEIWQTDARGVYDHPGDSGTATRDQNFQFFGTSVADDAGRYSFRTLLPGEYEPRPRHIHLKVKLDGRDLLTTQFYFSQDRTQVQGERIFQAAGEAGDALLVQLVEVVDSAGNPLLLGVNDIVVDAGLGAGPLDLTPSQAEGPYYPVVTVADYDNDLMVKE